MSYNWKESFDDLKQKLDSSNIFGKWEGNKFTSSERGVLIFHETTGNIQFQGKQHGKSILEALFVEGEGISIQPNNQVFVVYGHDKDARKDLDYFFPTTWLVDFFNEK